jgi:signal transduction histidine kinase
LRKPAAKRAMLLAAVWLLFAAHPAAAVETKTVLVLYANSRLLPANIAADRGLTTALTSAGHSVRIYSEFLDSPQFGGEAYESLMVAYLRGKYAAVPPDAIVAVSDEALIFVFKHRAQLFPTVPVVHEGVSSASLRGMQPMPADIVGIANDYDYAGTIAQALRWHPTAQRLVVITGASSRDRVQEARLRNEVPGIVGHVTADFWPALGMATLQSRLGALPADTVVFTTGLFRDGDGELFSPRDSAALIARASSVPVYAPFETFLGTGVVGGRMPSFEDMGAQTGGILQKLFAGSPPAALNLPNSTSTALHIDWRQAQRWGIAENSIPAGTIVHFRPPSFWEAYRTATMIALAVFFIQAALIAALYFERRRRSAAELTTQNLHTQLAHASRLAVAGELTASIAHEINQPLGAVQMSVDAADMMLQSGANHRADFIRVINRIQRDNMRASDVIRRLRTLLAKHEPERKAFDVGFAMADVVLMLRPEAERRKLSLDARQPAAPLYIAGDRIQIQQVLINLVLNAMDAEAGLAETRRHVEVLVERRNGNILITVNDRGHGIAPENLSELFEPFFSTKQHGMGLGLSIARSIIEAHGGRIWAENRAVQGMAFHVELLAAFAGSVPERSVA